MSAIRRILIVEDCSEDRETYRRFLTKDTNNPYCIIAADSAEEAIQHLRENLFHLILLDYRLPGMTGLDFLELLRENNLGSSIPVVFITGFGNEELAVEVLQNGAFDYLSKIGLTAKNLQKAVRNTLDRAQLQHRLERAKQRQQLLARTTVRIRKSLDLQTILETTVEDVRDLLQCTRVAICRYQEGEDSLVLVAESMRDDLLERRSSGKTEIATECCEGWPTEWSQWDDWSTVVDLEIGHDLATTSTSPFFIAAIRVDSGDAPRPWGLLVAHCCTAPPYVAGDERDALVEIAEQLAIGIQQAELLETTQRALHHQETLNCVISRNIATVSHEFRSPLATILAAAQTILEYHERLDWSAQKHYLEMIQQKTRSMNHLMDDILMAENLGWDEVELEPVEFDLADFVAETIDRYRQRSRYINPIRLVVSGTIGAFVGDRYLLNQALSAAIDNACKYSDESSIVQVSLSATDKGVELSVRDRGIGIPAEDLKHIGQLFCRGSNVGSIDGRGLGLAIAKTCVERHRGSLDLQSTLGCETVATFHFSRGGLKPKLHKPAVRSIEDPIEP